MKNKIIQTKIKQTITKLAVVVFTFSICVGYAFGNSFIILESHMMVQSDTNIIMDSQPRFPGCENVEVSERSLCAQTKLFEYIGANLKYPENARKNGIQGKVFCSFTVTKDGKIKEAKILRSLDPECDAEVLRVVETMNQMKESWIPGRAGGEAVNTEITLPVKFSF